MDDQEILKRISALVQQEHELESAGVGKGPNPDEEARLAQLEVTLDQCWDLLRQRRGRRDAGANPDEAHVRDPKTVEHYLQ